MKEFRKIVRNNFFFNVKISSNRRHLAGSYPIAAQVDKSAARRRQSQSKHRY
jgi:hypothetical protein